MATAAVSCIVLGDLDDDLDLDIVVATGLGAMWVEVTGGGVDAFQVHSLPTLGHVNIVAVADGEIVQDAGSGQHPGPS